MPTSALSKRLLQIGASLLLQAVVLFGFAGHLRWTMAWVYLACNVGIVVTIAVTVAARQPGLVEERSRLCAGTARWDRLLSGVLTVFGIAMLIVAGLDRRMVWSSVARVTQIAALIPFAGGSLLVARAMAANRFFSTAVRIQRDRGHTVVTDGPYRLVRHPGYAGFIATILMTPIVLGSQWALIPGLLTAAGYVARTALEDRFLQRELEGYADYARRVRHRLVPGVW
jgi:protein-S-isoprenylcysteine O-methyltransferase Ste14